MTFFTILHTIIIAPLSLFFEVVYAIAYRVIHNPGASIIALSLAMNFLVLPLYKQADAMQEEQRDIEMKLQPWIRHIKKNFKGDERMMMLQTYYRQNNYKPTDALKGSVSLLLEVPFFIAAYQFLSGLQMLNGVSFGPIKDLGTPDGMLVVAGVAINILPILMTTINFISGAIYTKGFPLKSKIQLYGMALVFLVFLYRSPAGLVFYWTLNNLFSLCKNIVYRLHAGKEKKGTITPTDSKDALTFFLGGCFLALLCGALIPLSVIHSSPAEFVNILNYSNPLHYVVYSFCLAIGLFIVWFGIFFRLGNGLSRKVMAAGIWVISVWALVDYMFFGTKNGTLSTLLKYDATLDYSRKAMLFNLFVLVAVGAVAVLLWWKNQGLIQVITIAAIVAVVTMSGVNTVQTNRSLVSVKAEIARANQNRATIPLSTDGKNVMVIMLDRSMGLYVPYMMAERPELMEQFDGFTFYPNALSYGLHTNFGSPALFGGYEYTPEGMNRRDDLLLGEKQNEALTLMPRLFDEAGYEVTVCDPPYAGYGWVPDLSIYDSYPDIHAYITKGQFTEVNPEREAKNEALRRRNFFCYSVFKVAPLVTQRILYNDGNYNNADAIYSAEHPDNVMDIAADEMQGSVLEQGPHGSVGINKNYLDAYNVLANLSSITEIQDGTTNTFLMMDNDTPHDVTLLQEPEYEPKPVVDNEAYDLEHANRFTLDGKTIEMDACVDYMHYQSNMAAFIALGNYFDYLREQGVYDNTRIILVADHGWDGVGMPDDVTADGTNIYGFNCLMMVKDFGSRGYQVSDELMTNADTPALVFERLIENPVNPYTGNPVDFEGKHTEELHLFGSNDFDVLINNGYRFMDGPWYGVKTDNVLDKSSWSIIEDPSK